MLVEPTKYPCPCCGYLTLSLPPGSFNICGICYWQDDVVQLRWAAYAAAANALSLIESQANFAKSPGADDRRDPGWRPVDLARESFEEWDDHVWLPWPDDLTVLYWWRPTFWRINADG